MTNFKEQLQSLIESALAEDVGDGDHSTLSSIPADTHGKAILKVKQEGILAGMEVAKAIFHFVEADTKFTGFMNDGERMQVGDVAFEVEALVHTILKCERLVLNSMQRMSGIATLTRTYVESVKGYKTKI